MRFLWFVIFLGACAPAKAPTPLALAAPATVVHADAGFTTRERAIILTAADYLDRAAGLRYEISFDLEMPPSLEHTQANQIWRLPSDAPFAESLDRVYKGVVFGATYQTSPFRTWLLPDRAPSTFLFLHVAEHELLHAIGCDHVQDPKAVLFKFTHPGDFEALELSDSDRAEIARVRAR